MEPGPLVDSWIEARREPCDRTYGSTVCPPIAACLSDVANFGGSADRLRTDAPARLAEAGGIELTPPTKAEALA